MFKRIYLVMVVSSFSSLFGQISSCDEIYYPIEESCILMPAYNSPSRIEIARCKDIFLTMSFLYWLPTQENMELGFTSSTGILSVDGDFVNADVEYKPGFKIGLGCNLSRDHWDTYLEYTWFHGSHQTSVTLDPTGPVALHPSFIIPDVNSSSYFGGHENWELRMDLVDFLLARHYHVGLDLFFHPFLGIRAARIDQNLNSGYFTESTGILGFADVFTKQATSSWGLGPKMGLQMDWLLGRNVRFYGIGSGDILFTRYTDLTYFQFAKDEFGIESSFNRYVFRQKDLDFLRSHIDLELGFSWGTYFACNHRHVDFSVGYCFQVFFDQNCFRNFLDDQVLAKSIFPNGNLYIHGLNATVRLDF